MSLISGDPTTIRPARHDDVIAMVDLRAELFRDLARTGSATRPELVDDDTWRERATEVLSSEIARDDRQCLVAATESRQHGESSWNLVGWGRAVLHMGLPGPGFPSGRMGLINSLVVAPSHRGRGVGSALTSGLIDWLDEAGAEVVDLLASGDAEVMYRRLGFVEPQQTALRRLPG